MKYNYDKLKGRIVEKFKSQTKFAEAMDLSTRSLSLKLNNERDFKQKEISKACQLLVIEADEIADYFFTPEIQMA